MRSLSFVCSAAALALGLWAGPAAAQAVGDVVRIEMENGAIEGTLVDRLPAGYLVRNQAGTTVVPYGSVRSIGRARLEPAPAPPGYGAPYVAPPLPEAPQYEARSPELAAAGRTLGILGVVAVLTGAVLAPTGTILRNQATCHDPTDRLHFDCGTMTGRELTAAGYINLAGGAALAITGLVMYRVGRSVERISFAEIPRVAAGPSGVTLAWSF